MTKLFLIVCLYLLYTRCELLSESYLCIIVHNWWRGKSSCTQLWIAFRIVSLHYRSQPKLISATQDIVVNCFQNRIFALSFTTFTVFSRCCVSVVNCFQNRIFALSFTTFFEIVYQKRRLWIAFRIVSLHYRSQRLGGIIDAEHGCELLSESYLCIIVHNNQILLWYPNGLWIAFRIVSLHYRSQPFLKFSTNNGGCELLSESYLCIIVHNYLYTLRQYIQLWIAFRIVSLHYRSQRHRYLSMSGRCCELLSESYLCIIVHNPRTCCTQSCDVVNCFQNRIFALSFTTFVRLINCGHSCELLSESYLCIIVHNLREDYN